MCWTIGSGPTIRNGCMPIAWFGLPCWFCWRPFSIEGCWARPGSFNPGGTNSTGKLGAEYAAQQHSGRRLGAAQPSENGSYQSDASQLGVPWHRSCGACRARSGNISSSRAAVIAGSRATGIPASSPSQRCRALPVGSARSKRSLSLPYTATRNVAANARRWRAGVGGRWGTRCYAMVRTARSCCVRRKL